MLLKYGLPVIAAICLAFAVITSLDGQRTSAAAAGHGSPVGSPGLAATGIVEARTGNIAVASPVPGIVAQVMVEVGQRVRRYAAVSPG